MMNDDVKKTIEPSKLDGPRVCELCGLQVDKIPRFKRGECPGNLQHQFVFVMGVQKGRGWPE